MTVTRVFLFDIDGTLIMSGGAGRAALCAAMEAAFGLPLRHDVDLHGRTDRWIGQQLLEHHELQDTEANWRKLRKAYLGLLPDHLNLREGCVLPGVVGLLQRLAAESWAAVGLLTGNMRRGADIKLRHFSLDGFVNSDSFGGFGDDHHCRNRVAADALDSAESAIGRAIDPEAVWVVGDTPRDVDCARAIGARAAAVATGGYTTEQLAERQPDLLLETLEDAAALLQ